MFPLPPRRGMTTNQLINGFWWFGFIGLVLLVGAGMVFPAIYSAREAARRSTCKNNLKQFGLALRNYHDTHQTFPPGYVYREKQNNYGWSASILPYLDASPIYSQINFDGEWNPALASQIHPTFLCPGDPRTPVGIGGLARSNYPGSHGHEELRDDLETASGVLYRNSSVNYKKIQDGSSHTMMLGERSRSENGYPAHTGLWIGYRQGVGPIDLLFRAPKGLGKAPGDVHVLINVGDGSGISSNHKGGAHVLFCDGAVNFVSDKTEPIVLHRLSTRAAGDSEPCGGIIWD